MNRSLLIAVILLCSCGQGQKKGFRDSTPTFPITDDPSTQSQTYLWDDPDCIAQKKSPVALPVATLTDWSQMGAQDVPTPLGSLVGANGELDPSEVGGGTITTQDLYSRVCEHRGSDGICLNALNEAIGWAAKSPGQVPRFCNLQGHYTRDSLERVSLTAAFHLRNAISFIRNVLPQAPNLQGVELKVLATFESLWSPTALGTNNDGRGARSVLVDNASYFPTSNSGYNPFIAILPRRLGSQDDTPRLWESGFVIAHELAHHLEHTLGLDHFGDARRTLIRLALSEAFADLLGLASLKLSDASLSHTPCLAGRSPSRENFEDGRVKSLDSHILAALQKQEPKDSARSTLTAALAKPLAHQHLNLCSTPNRFSFHDLGAVFAHAFYDLMMQSFDVLEISPQDRPALFAQQATRWMKAIEADISVGQHAKRDIGSAAKALESTIMSLFQDQARTLPANVEVVLCQKLSFFFSGLKQTQWFHRGQACS